MRFGGSPDMQVHQLVKKRLQNVAGADPRVGGDGEAELARHGEAEAARALARPPHL
jgi:hypothetical protein